MASISKLSIRGIRSFSPTDSEEVISFSHPVTIIVGANGCGKTTIIESLKYVITGSLPPGNKSGQAFLHDPKSVGQTIVKGCIKLRFQNRAGNSMVVVRSMELTQKKSTMSFKQMDGILRTSDPVTGEKVSMSHKCTELDRQIPALMGVSKAILEHVVFCHQEDSSWPLMEGAVLKKRFDEIFDSTRYTKALEEIRKTRLKYVSNSKDEKADLEGLASHKFAAEGFRREIETCEEKFEELNREVEECEQKVLVQEEKMRKFEQVLSKVDGMREKLMEKEGEVERVKSNSEHMRNVLEKDLTETHNENQLKKMLLSFDKTVEDERRLLEVKEEECESIKRDIDTLSGKLKELYRDKAKLESEKEQNETRINERASLVLRMAQEYDIELPTSRPSIGSIASTAANTQLPTLTQQSHTTQQLSPQDISTFLQNLQAKETQLQTQLQKLRQDLQKQEDTIQSKILELKSKQNSIETERSRISSDLFSSKQELHSLSSQSQTTTSSSGSRVRKTEVEEAKRNATQATQDHKTLTQNPKLNDIPKEIRTMERDIDKLKRSIEDESEAVKELRQNEGEQRDVSLLKDQVLSENERLEEILKDHSFSWQKYNLETPTSNLQSLETIVENVRDKCEEKRLKKERMRQDQSQKQSMVTEKRALLHHSNKSLQEYKQQMNALTSNDNGGIQKIKRVINGIRRSETEQLGSTNVQHDHDPQELITYIENKIKDMNVADDSPETVSRMIRKLKNLARVEDSSGNLDIICPCCRRSMDEDETKIFQDNMLSLSDPTSSILILDPSQAQIIKNQKQQHERWKTILTSSINDHINYKRLFATCQDMEEKIGREQEEVALLEADLSILKSQADDMDLEHVDLQTLLHETIRMRDDATKITEKEYKIKTKQQHLAMMAPSSDGRDLRQLELDLKEKQDRKDQMQEKISSLNKEMAKLNNRISEAARYMNDAEQKAREKEARYIKDQEVMKKKQELNEKIASFTEEDKKLQEQLLPLRQQISSKQAEIHRLRTSLKTEENHQNSTLHTLHRDIQSLQTLHTQIETFLNSDKLHQLDSQLDQITKRESRRNQKEMELKELEPELERMRSEERERGRYKKSIENNLRLLESMKRLESLKEEVEVLKEEVKEVEGKDDSRRRYDEALAKKKELVEEKARCEGRIGGLKDQRRMIKHKLRTPEYNDIDERHRIKMIEYETTKIVVSDLDKYHKALDQALLHYHGMKIEDINKIIRELWILTYKGQDITNIQIVSGQDSGSRASRSYNYRVVMTKGNTPLDMRGRCSAGQRVLASIVIRLALAETFCLNCGVMALDEPTTNLDYENKRGLAIALAQIIATRAVVQHNFQLIIITHDEDFVAMMKNELSTTQAGFDMPEKFYQISRMEARDGKHYSKIEAVDWDEL